MSKRFLVVAGGLAVLMALGAWWRLSSRGASPGASSATGRVGAAATSSSPAGPRPPRGAASTVDDRVGLAPAVAQGLLDFARKPWTKVPLRGDEHARARMRGIAGRAIDLDRAHARKSTRFRRTSYTQDVTTDAPIHLDDRRGPDGRPTTRTSIEPMRVVYREGDDGTTFELAKLKEQISPGAGVDPAVATQQAERFFVDNGLLAETAADQIEPYEVRERRVAAEAPEGGAEQDLLAQQDVLLRRTYEGKQVINSRATVGLLPGSGEVVQIRLERWSPVDPSGATTIKPELSGDDARRTAELLEDKLRRQIELETGAALASAKIEHVEEAWFQSDAGLIPVLVFVVRVVFVHEPNEARNLVIAINPSGDDSLIWDQGRIVRGPSSEPTDPM